MLSPAPVVPARSSSTSPGSPPSPPRLASFRSEGHCLPLRRLITFLFEGRRLPFRGSPLSKSPRVSAPAYSGASSFSRFKLSRPTPCAWAKEARPLRLRNFFSRRRRRTFLAWKRSFPALEKLFSFEGKFPSFRKAGSFCPKRNSLPFERKWLPFRRESIPLPQSEKFPSARKFISLRKKKYFLAEGNLFLCARK